MHGNDAASQFHHFFFYRYIHFILLILELFFFIQSGELSGGDHVSRQVTQEVFISPRLIRRCLLKFTLGKTYWLYFRIPQPLNWRHFPFGKRCGCDSRIGVVAILPVVVATSNQLALRMTIWQPLPRKPQLYPSNRVKTLKNSKECPQIPEPWDQPPIHKTPHESPD